MQKKLLNISLEGNLLKEIKDILDELHIMTRIKFQQQMVAESFIKHIKEIIEPKLAQWERQQIGSPPPSEPNTPNIGGLGSPESQLMEQINNARWTLTRASDLLKGAQDRIRELTALEDAARNTSAAVRNISFYGASSGTNKVQLKDLLALKQQQAGVIEAREAVKQAKETLKQGRSIILFTVVSIVFVSFRIYHSTL
jgi:hypothetical protein